MSDKQYSGKGIIFDIGLPQYYQPGFTVADFEALLTQVKAHIAKRDIVGETMSAAQYVRQMPEENNG